MLQTDGLVPAPSYEWLVRQTPDQEERVREIETLSRPELTRRFGAFVLTLAAAYVNTPTIAFGTRDVLDSWQDVYRHCKSADQEEKERIASLLAASNPIAPIEDLDPETADARDYNGREDAWYSAKAALWNLTVPGYRAEFTDLQSELKSGAESLRSNQEYLDQANTFLEQYGVHISTNQDDIHPSATAISSEDFNDIQFRRHLYSIVSTFGVLPTEFVRALDSVERVVIQRLPEQELLDGNRGIPSGKYIAKTKSILIHYDQTSSGTFPHELGHGINAALNCRWDDPSFAALNPESIYVDRGVGPADIPRYLSADISAQQRAFYNLRNALTEAIYVGDTAKAQQLRSDALELGERFITYSQYSRSNTEEDKAEVFTAILGDIMYDNVFTTLDTNSEEFPVLYAKRLELLSRIDRFHPGLAGYIGDISGNPTTLEDSWYYNQDEWGEMN